MSYGAALLVRYGDLKEISLANINSSLLPKQGRKFRNSWSGWLRNYLQMVVKIMLEQRSLHIIWIFLESTQRCMMRTTSGIVRNSLKSNNVLRTSWLGSTSGAHSASVALEFLNTECEKPSLRSFCGVLRGSMFSWLLDLFGVGGAHIVQIIRLPFPVTGGTAGPKDEIQFLLRRCNAFGNPFGWDFVLVTNPLLTSQDTSRSAMSSYV